MSIGQCRDDRGQIIGWCLFSTERDRQDAADAAYYQSIGYHALADLSRRRRTERRKLMGWPPA